MIEAHEDIKAIVRTLFKDDQGKPIEQTDGQSYITACIAKKLYSRLLIMPHTRYGKSMNAGIATLLRACTFPEKWIIIGGDRNKANIIMSHINAHIFDNDFTKSRFIHTKYEENEIRKHRNKSHITFDLGSSKISEIIICTAKEALGFGGDNVIGDENGLIPDDEQVLVDRMIGDNPLENFLCKIGNPFYRNHFYRSYLDPRYHKIVIDCYQGLKEGRISEEIINDMRGKKFFGPLYECKFPSPEEMDNDGWMYLISEELVRKAQARQVEPHGLRRLGVDVARGGRNFNVWVLRYDNYAKLLRKDHDNDLMSVAGKTIAFAKEHNVKAEDISIDDVGVGGGVSDRCREAGWKINAVKEGAAATENKEYANVRAEMYASDKNGLYAWLMQGGALSDDPEWFELIEIRYKKDGSSRTKLESKEDMLARGVDSPDVSDGLALTFAKKAQQFFGMPSEDDIKNALMNQGGVYEPGGFVYDKTLGF